MARKLKAYEKELLEEGNTFTMGALLREFYPEDMEREGFDLKEYVNHYKAYITFNPADKTYTFAGKNGKAYFNTDAVCIGFKEW